MRFRRLDIVRFGPLTGRTLELDPGANVFCGPNESGKSSLRSLLETVLFGFDPATRDAHPLARFRPAAGDLHVEAELLLERPAARVQRVERVLQSVGKLRLADADAPFEGRRGTNRPLNAAADVQRSLYRAVYALGPEDLVGLGEDVQRSIDQLLLPESTMAELEPTWRVLARLRSDADALWRADRRGRPRTRELRGELAGARRRLAQAMAEERSILALRGERADLRSELHGLDRELAALQAEERDAPLLEELHALERQREALPPPVDLRPLAGEPLTDPTELIIELDELDAQMDDPRASLAEPELALSPVHAALLERADTIARSLAQQGQHDAAQEELADLSVQVAQEQAAAHDRLRDLVDGELAAAALQRIPLEAVAAAQADWAEALGRRPGPDGRGASLWFVLAALLGAGAALSVTAPLWLELLGVDGFADVDGTGAGPDRALWLAAGLALGAVAAACLGRFTSAPGGRAAARPQLDPDVRTLLLDAGVAPALLASPPALGRLLDGLRHAAVALRAAERISLRASSLHERVAARAERWLTLCRELAIDPGGEEPAVRLQQELDEALHQQQLVQANVERRLAAQRTLTSLRPAYERKSAQLERVRAAIAHNGLDPRRGLRSFRALVARVRAEEACEERERALRARPEFERLLRGANSTSESGMSARWRAVLDSDAPPWSEASSAGRRARVAELRTRRDAIQHRVGEINALWEQDGGSREAEAREAVQALEQRLNDAEQERDRLALLERIIVHADRDYRAEHQPDVLRHASAHLATLTNGRYTRLEYPDGPTGGLWVQLDGEDEAVPVGEPLSRGTREQIQLALRLGWLDHLDQARERLPLVLDEAFVHWDAARRASAYRLLRDVARTRQVFFLTCHESLASEASEVFQSASLRLGEPAQGPAASADFAP